MRKSWGSGWPPGGSLYWMKGNIFDSYMWVTTMAVECFEQILGFWYLNLRLMLSRRVSLCEAHGYKADPHGSK
jgi:hypothetical protein